MVHTETGSFAFFRLLIMFVPKLCKFVSSNLNFCFQKCGLQIVKDTFQITPSVLKEIDLAPRVDTKLHSKKLHANNQRGVRVERESNCNLCFYFYFCFPSCARGKSKTSWVKRKRNRKGSDAEQTLIDTASISLYAFRSTAGSQLSSTGSSHVLWGCREHNPGNQGELLGRNMSHEWPWSLPSKSQWPSPPGNKPSLLPACRRWGGASVVGLMM